MKRPSVIQGFCGVLVVTEKNVSGNAWENFQEIFVGINGVRS